MNVPATLPAPSPQASRRDQAPAGDFADTLAGVSSARAERADAPSDRRDRRGPLERSGPPAPTARDAATDDVDTVAGEDLAEDGTAAAPSAPGDEHRSETARAVLAAMIAWRAEPVGTLGAAIRAAASPHHAAPTDDVAAVGVGEPAAEAETPVDEPVAEDAPPEGGEMPVETAAPGDAVATADVALPDLPVSAEVPEGSAPAAAAADAPAAAAPAHAAPAEPAPEVAAEVAETAPVQPRPSPVAAAAREHEAKPVEPVRSEGVDPAAVRSPAAGPAVGTAPASHPTGPSPAAAPTALDRVLQVVEQLESAPPPRRMTVDLEGVQVTVSLRGRVVHVDVTAGRPSLLPEGWSRQIGAALASRGFAFAGDQPRDRQDPREQAPPPRRAARPAARRVSDGALSL